MAWWITVYCQKPLPELTPERLRAGITDEDPEASAGADYFTLAEGYGVDDAQVRPALQALRVTDDLKLHFGDARPVVVHRWTEPDRVAEELAECHEVRAPPPSIREPLGRTKEIVAIELGLTNLEDMGVVFAYEVARYVAQKGDGLIVDDDDRWRRVVRGAFEVLAA
jgi:hypothetical protein